MDKLHFDDLTKITCPPGMLDDDTFQRLKAWPHGWEFWDGDEWYIARVVDLVDVEVTRARPAPLTQDVVPWDALADWVQCVARDEDGKAGAFEGIPQQGRWKWIKGYGKTERIDHILKGYQPGTVHWTDSLQKRPEGV